MAKDFGMKSGVDYLPHYNWEPGMNDDLAYADRTGYSTSVAMLTEGQAADWDTFGGPEVAPSNYEMDPMGEERELATFSREQPEASAPIGMARQERGVGEQDNADYVITTGGKRVAMAPQNYSRGSALRRKE